MCEPGHDLDLAQEPIGSDRRRDVAVEDLDRDLPAMLEVVREEDRRHSAAPQLAVEAIALGQSPREVFGSVGRHRVTLPQERRNEWGSRNGYDLGYENRVKACPLVSGEARRPRACKSGGDSTSRGSTGTQIFFSGTSASLPILPWGAGASSKHGFDTPRRLPATLGQKPAEGHEVEQLQSWSRGLQGFTVQG